MNYLEIPTLGQTTANIPMVMSIIEDKKPSEHFNHLWFVAAAVLWIGLYVASKDHKVK